ncbi:crossover junction endodeoxyribonuclease RusA [Massilia sp. PDC64]|nr:RusA family crossover junction endodeoxyribonuclease [Massilia sp. PDC64]SDC66555.1 crossover junction endodeoxyribonuclease RusA [Massilia sp. PDC64]
MIVLTLPYPLSANRYWRPVKLGAHISIVPTKEAKAFRADIAARCRDQGVRVPLAGRVHIDVKLYPARPQDWQRRMRVDGAAWDDTVRCIDIDNANKVLLDALKDVAIEDDKWVRRLTSERMEPDGEARVVVTITSMPVAQPQADLLGEAA